MAVIGHWLPLNLRRRWRALLVLMLLIALAAWPAHRASSMRVGHVLRAE